MSTLKVNTLEEATSGGATFFTTKAWVNFNGTGTVAIRADGNVSSITDNGAGFYRTNFSTALSSASYSLGQSSGYNTTNVTDVGHLGIAGTPATTSVQVFAVDTTVNNPAFDYPHITLGVTL